MNMLLCESEIKKDTEAFVDNMLIPRVFPHYEWNQKHLQYKNISKVVQSRDVFVSIQFILTWIFLLRNHNAEPADKLIHAWGDGYIVINYTWFLTFMLLKNVY